MSIDVLKRELAGLAPGERNQIVAFLLSLQHSQDADYRAKLARKIDDQNPANWADLSELEKRLSDRAD